MSKGKRRQFGDSPEEMLAKRRLGTFEYECRKKLADGEIQARKGVKTIGVDKEGYWTKFDDGSGYYHIPTPKPIYFDGTEETPPTKTWDYNRLKELYDEAQKNSQDWQQNWKIFQNEYPGNFEQPKPVDPIEDWTEKWAKEHEEHESHES